MKKAILSVIVMSIGSVLGACSGGGDPQPASPGEPTTPEAVVALYSAAISSRSFTDYLALHAEGFVVERLEDGRHCLPWLDSTWWDTGSLPAECAGEFVDVHFAIIDWRSSPDEPIELMLDAETSVLVGPDSGWHRQGRLVLYLAEQDGRLLITRVAERAIL
jgi:hypothetical protein